MKKSMFFAAVAVAAMALTAAVEAATVNVTVELNPGAPGCAGCTLSGPGTYNVFATASPGDNQGIASYSISVQNVSTLLHRAPRVTSSTNDEGDGGPAGFSLFRSANNAVVTGTGFMVGASQDTVAPTPYIINGFGQTAGSFAASLPAGNTNVGIIQPTWNGKLLLAEGMYNVNGAAPSIDFSNIDVFANVFSGSGIVKATLGGGVPPANPIVGDLALVQNTIAQVVGGNIPVTDVTTLTLNNAAAPIFTPLIPGKPLILNTPPTVNNAGAFSWNTAGALRGTYVWGVTGVNGANSDGGTVTVTVNAVPEPATFALIGLALVGFAGFRRK